MRVLIYLPHMLRPGQPRKLVAEFFSATSSDSNYAPAPHTPPSLAPSSGYVYLLCGQQVYCGGHSRGFVDPLTHTFVFAASPGPVAFRVPGSFAALEPTGTATATAAAAACQLNAPDTPLLLVVALIAVPNVDNRCGQRRRSNSCQPTFIDGQLNSQNCAPLECCDITPQLRSIASIKADV